MSETIRSLLGESALKPALDSVAALARAGWVVVAREPDQAMLEAAATETGIDQDCLARAWDTMLRNC
jgi:hypothetical protein